MTDELEERRAFKNWLLDRDSVDEVNYSRDVYSEILVKFGNGVPELTEISDRAKELGYYFYPRDDDWYVLSQERIQ